MNDIRPFRGLRYDENVAGPLSNLLCPPYDVISPVEQLNLHGKSPNNVVRLELGLEFPEDDGASNRYTRAAATLDSWLETGVLKAEDEPALYMYEQSFAHQGGTVARRGILARLRLTPWAEGVVLPHEETLAKPKADRLQLMRATATNLSPVFLLFEDSERAITALMEETASQLPVAEATTENGQVHRLWVVQGDLMDRMVRALQTPQLYMADGHHRYETALAYRDEMLSPGDGEHPRDFVMALLVDAANPGLVVLPTHRLVYGVDESKLGVLLERLRERFEVEEIPYGRPTPNRKGSAADAGPTLGLYLGPEKGAYRLELKEGHADPATRGRPTLDVDLLHDLVLEELLGIGPAELRAGGMVSYTRDPVEAVKAVDGGVAQAAFFLNPTRVEQVLETARAGGRMPQKSTYFYPKPETGLVINPLR